MHGLVRMRGTFTREGSNVLFTDCDHTVDTIHYPGARKHSSYVGGLMQQVQLLDFVQHDAVPDEHKLLLSLLNKTGKLPTRNAMI